MVALSHTWNEASHTWNEARVVTLWRQKTVRNTSMTTNLPSDHRHGRWELEDQGHLHHASSWRDQHLQEGQPVPAEDWQQFVSHAEHPIHPLHSLGWTYVRAAWGQAHALWRMQLHCPQCRSLRRVRWAQQPEDILAWAAPVTLNFS